MTTTGQKEMVLPIHQVGAPETEIRLERILRRGDFLDQLDGSDKDTPLAQVIGILSQVRESGDEAVARFTQEHDGVEVATDALAVPTDQLAEAWGGLGAADRAALEAARDAIGRYQESIFQSGIRIVTGFARQLELRFTPVRRVGIYIPGGRAAYPSTALMTAVPASVAGVPEIAACTPPDENGKVPQSILAACHLCGVTEVYCVGGAQAVAAMAYGTDTIPAVDMVVGPGNIYVTLAKRMVFGRVGVDVLAGPTELLVLADESANSAWIAADLLAQAEHDPQAACILITTQQKLAQQVVDQLRVQIEALPRKDVCAEALSEYGLILVAESIDEACALADRIAPEHLSVMTSNPESVAQKVSNAAATFVGPFTPEVVGDYLAGPSHVLPTGSTARFCSGLSVFDFLVRRSRVFFEKEGLRNDLSHLVQLARLEQLEGHARSAEMRFEKPGPTE